MICPECKKELTNDGDAYGHDCEVDDDVKEYMEESISITRGRYIELCEKEKVYDYGQGKEVQYDY